MIPEPGQLVNVRQRTFVVAEVEKSAIPTVLGPKGAEEAQHLVSLSSVEDDALGDELQVVWELEPGARVHEKGSLPEADGFDDPLRLDAFLDAVRWGAISSADHKALQSPFRSGIEIEDYQLDPVVRALRMPRVNLLIADDVGLGKTIEAGLVAQELILRHRVRTILVVCPSSIQIQWQEQMRDKFGLEFRIVDSALMKQLRRQRGLHVNPWTHFPRLITSIDFLKRDRSMRLFREVLPAEGEPRYPRRFDLLILDEAHNVAPAGSGNYATDSQRTAAIRTISDHFEHRLFLTATPHNGYPESFSSLLELLDNQRFARAVRPSPDQLGAIMIRRLKSDPAFVKWDGTPLFPERRIACIEVPYSEEERRAHAALTEYTKLRQSGLSDAAEKYATEFVLKVLKKRLFSSPAAFCTTLEQHVASIKSARRASGVAAKPSVGILRRRAEEVQEEFADDELYEDQTGELVESASRLFRNLTADEERLVRELRQYAERASARADCKARQLIDWLHGTVKPGGGWGDERVLIFTEYRATQKWLQGILAAEGLAGGERLMTLYGGMDSRNRERIKAAFQTDPKVSPVRILLATDAASEGIDLQNHCHRLIHYEIPWNPNRMEQRNGRLDRHGQKASEVLVYHFVGKGFDAKNVTSVPVGQVEGDLEFLVRAAIKVNAIREDLGKVGPVISSQVEEAMLGRRHTLDTARAESEADQPRRMLRIERDLRRHIEQLHDQLQETVRDLRMSPENIQEVVSVGLQLAGQPPLREAAAPGIWPDPTGRRTRCPVFHLPALTGSWARCTEGLAHPHTGVIRPIVFDNSLMAGRDDVVLAHLNHRLVQMCLRLLRAEIWARGGTRRLHRVTARLIPNDISDVPAVIAHGRLVVLGGDNHRLHEEVISAGGLIRDGRFARLNVGQVKDFLAAAADEPAPEHIRDRLKALWPSLRDSVFQSLEARMRERTANLDKFLQERAEKEVADITAVLTELQRTILAELSTEEPLQLELWTDPEKEQLQRNRDSLLARAERIPEEIRRETENLLRRYSGPTPRMFPVAVTFLVPEKLARGEGGLR